MLPPLVTGRRRSLLALVTACGLGAAALAGASAWATAASPAGPVALALILCGAALGIGALRACERVLGERAAQEYVQEIRVGLVDAALRGPATSRGVLIARTTNDLSAVRNWVALGIGPLTGAIPLIAGCAAVLTVMHPALGAVFGSLVVLLGALLAALSLPMRRRSREVRRRRGRLAAAMSDTVDALPTIRAARGERREKNHIDRLGRGVLRANMRRVRVTGAARGAAAAVAALATGAVVVVGAVGVVTPATATAGLLVVGVAAVPLQDLGRVVEYRQNFRVARRVLGPALAAGERTGDPPAPAEADEGAAAWSARGLRVGGAELPDIELRPGARILVDTGSLRRDAAAVDALIGVAEPDAGVVLAGGSPVGAADRRAVRRLIGVCRGSDRLPRGSLDRAVRYRVPESEPGDADAIIDALGLDAAVRRLPQGRETMLRRGGAPLTEQEALLVHVARAAFRAPDVLVVDDVARGLDAASLGRVRALVRSHPGAVVTTDAELLAGEEHARWSPRAA